MRQKIPSRRKSPPELLLASLLASFVNEMLVREVNPLLQALLGDECKLHAMPMRDEGEGRFANLILAGLDFTHKSEIIAGKSD